MIFGYARVSTDAQDLTAQLKDLKAAGCERVFKEKVTGATADRPQLKKPLATVGHGDVVIIAAVDRLSRDTTDLMVIARDLQKAGAGLRSLAEPVVDTTRQGSSRARRRRAHALLAHSKNCQRLDRQPLVDDREASQGEAARVRSWRGPKPTLPDSIFNPA